MSYDFLSKEGNDFDGGRADSPVFVLGKFSKRRHDLLGEILDAKHVSDLIE